MSFCSIDEQGKGHQRDNLTQEGTEGRIDEILRRQIDDVLEPRLAMSSRHVFLECQYPGIGHESFLVDGHPDARLQDIDGGDDNAGGDSAETGRKQQPGLAKTGALSKFDYFHHQRGGDERDHDHEDLPKKCHTNESWYFGNPRRDCFLLLS